MEKSPKIQQQTESKSTTETGQSTPQGLASFPLYQSDRLSGYYSQLAVLSEKANLGIWGDYANLHNDWCTVGEDFHNTYTKLTKEIGTK